MQKIFYSIILLTIASWSNAQQQGPYLSFDDLKHDFGTIKENAGEAVYQFEFANTGNQPLIIQNVKPSCGCTTPEYSKAPVLPGERGFITVKYNPKGRPGPFDKSITVTTNQEPSTTVLTITGSVEPGEKTIEDIYRYPMGDIRMDKRNVYIPQVAPGEIKTSSVNIVNTSSSSITPQFKGVPAHLKIEVKPATLAPQEKGEIIVTFDAGKINKWGSNTDWVVFSTDDKLYNNKLAVTTNIQEDFSKLTPEELKNAPVINIEEDSYDFGSIKQGDTIQHIFKLTNSGKSNLFIRNVSASCGCTAVKPSKDVVAPGETVDLKAEFNSAGKSGKQTKSITVISNDPKNTQKILWLRGNVDTM